MTSLDFQALDLRRLAMDPVTCAPRNKVRSMDKTFVVAWTAIFSAVRQTHVAWSMLLARGAGVQEMCDWASHVPRSQRSSIQPLSLCKWSRHSVRTLGQIELPKSIVRILT